MTMEHYAEEYFLAADLLTPSIRRLMAEKSQATDPYTLRQLNRQLRILQDIRRETKAIGRYLQHYYDHRKEL